MNDRISRSDYGLTGIWIPASIYFDESLSFIEKMILTDIRHLCELRGCFKTNKAFADFHSVSERSVKRAIARLKSKGFIVVDIAKRHLRTLALTQKYLNVYSALGVGQIGLGVGQDDTGVGQIGLGVGGRKPVHDVGGEQLQSRAGAPKNYTKNRRSKAPAARGAAAPDPAASGGVNPSGLNGAAAPDPAEAAAANFIRQWKEMFPRVHEQKQATIITCEKEEAVIFFRDNPHRTPNGLLGLAVGAWMMPDEEDAKGTKAYWYCNNKSHRVKHFLKFLPEIEDQMEWKDTPEQHAKIHAALDKRFPVVKACR